MIRAAASLTGLTVVFALVLYLSYSCGNDATDSPSPTPTPSATVEQATPAATPRIKPSVTPTPDPTPAPRFSSQIPFPEDTALIVATGCYGCGGRPSGLRRIYRDPTGAIRIDQILSVFEPDVERRDDGGIAYITGLAVSPDGSDMMVSLCIKDGCDDGGVGVWSPDSAVVIIRSTDGGVTWREMGEFKGAFHLLGMIDDGLAYGYWYASSIDENPSVQPRFALFPTLEPIAPPAVGAWPHASVNGRIVWTSPSAPKSLLYSDSSEFLHLGDDARAIREAFDPYRSGDDVPVVWISGTGEYALSLVALDGTVTSTVPITLGFGAVLVDAPGSVYMNASVESPEPGVKLPTPFFGQVPVIVDMETGTIHPISDHLQPDERGGRDSLLAVQTGPFARVDDTRSCLNLRTSPGLDATKVACLADGVLLRHDSVAVTNQDVEWLQVTAPDGTQGWAATEFLEW